MEFAITQSQAILLDLLTDSQLADMREANKDNADVVALIDTRKADKAEALADKMLLDTFTTSLGTLELPEAPKGVLNIYRAWREGNRHITNAEVKEVLKANVNLDESEVKARLIPSGVWAWGDWTLNKAMSTTTTKASGDTKTRKLAVTVFNRDGSNLTLDGNFRTSKEACEHYGYSTKGDSARRVLEAHKKVVDDYEGDDYLVKQV